MRKNIIALLSILFCISVIIFLSQYFFRNGEPLPNQSVVESMFTQSVSDFRPEPNERRLFMTSVLLLPFLCAIPYIFLNHFRVTQSKRTKLYMQALLLLASILLILLVDYSLKNTVFQFLKLNSFNTYPVITTVWIILLLLILAASYRFEKRHPSISKRLIFMIYYGVGISLILMISLETIHSDTEPVVFIKNSWEHLHFTAYFDAMVQAYLGKSVSGLNPQYGYYPIFLIPLFKIIGLTILNFTIVMGILKLIAYLGLLVTLRNLTDNWIIALIGFITMIFYTRIRVPLDTNIEPYFQYNPHRLFFPAIFIFLTWLYISRKTHVSRIVVYSLNTLVASASILWNPDTGTIVFVSWLLSLAFIESINLSVKGIKTFTRNMAKHVIISFSILAFFVLAFLFYEHNQTGKWPNPINNFAYAQLFYNYGFFMLSLPRRLHPWMWVALSYIVGMYFAISHILDANNMGAHQVSRDSRQDTKSILTFTIAVIGVGIFTYYQGRSHNYNLIAISWPAYMLLTLYTDRLLTKISRIINSRSVRGIRASLIGRYAYQLIYFGFFFCFLGSSITSLVVNLPEYKEVITTRLAGINQANVSLRQHSQFIRETSSDQDTVLILSDEATELYLYTNHRRPIDIPGFSELVLEADVNKLNDFILHPTQEVKIYWDTSFQFTDPSKYPNLVPITRSHDLILFEAKNDDYTRTSSNNIQN